MEMRNAFFACFVLLALPVSGEEVPSIDEILQSVRGQGPWDVNEPEDTDVTSEKLIESFNFAEEQFQRRVAQKGDRQLQVLQAITLMNPGIAYIADRELHADRYEEQVKIRAKLADEFVRLAKIEKPNPAPKPPPPAVGGAGPSIDAILRAVQKQAPSAKGVPSEAEISSEKLTEPNIAEILFSRRIVRAGDRMTQLLHAITILNFSIHHIQALTEAEQEPYKEDLPKMVQFRARLADEFVRLSEIEKTAKAGN